MFKIVIPTHNRVGKQLTLNTLPAAVRSAVVLVTGSESEAEALRKTESLKKSQVLVAHGAYGTSIARKRQWIVDKLNASSAILMLDDDMTPFGRCPVKQRAYTNGRWKPLPGFSGMSREYATESFLEAKFAELERALTQHAHAGVSSRLGNDTEEAEVRIAPQRMMHAIGYARGVLKRERIRFDAVSCREDFHVTLELLKRGEKSWVTYDMCYSPAAYGAAGGCSSERSIASSDAAAHKLAALHAPFVKVVEKLYKETPRQEVIVQWKKAYDSHLKT